MIKGNGSRRKCMQVSNCFYMFLALLSEFEFCKTIFLPTSATRGKKNNRKASLYVSHNGLVNQAV